MAGSTKFPGALDDGTTLYQPGGGDLVASVDHAALHDNVDVAIIATQTKLGTGSSTSSSGTVLRGNGSGTSQWAQANLTSDVTGTLPVANGGSGVTGSTGSGNLVLSNSPTLSAPAFTSISNTGLLTLPTSTDTLLGRATTDTLTNKSISGSANTLTNLPYSALLSSIFSGQLSTQVNAGTAGGNMWWVNLGGIKILWGLSGNISVTSGGSTFGFTLPSFFTSLQMTIATLNNIGSTANQSTTTTTTTTSSIVVQAYASTTTVSTENISILVIGA